MIFRIKEILAYGKKCHSVSNGAGKAGLKRISRFLKKLLDKGRAEIDSFYLLCKVAQTGHSKAKAEVKMVANIFSSLDQRCGYLEELQVKRAILIARNASKKLPKKKRFVSKSLFNDAVQDLGQKKDLFLCSLLASGRRMIDLSRADWADYKQVSPAKFIVKIQKDKKNDHDIYFTLDYGLVPSGWSKFSGLEMAEAMLKLVRQEKGQQPFGCFKSSNFSATCNFRAHTLRSVAAIFRTIRGVPDDIIMKDIGWRDESSLKRYRKLTREQILDLGDLDRAISMIAG